MTATTAFSPWQRRRCHTPAESGWFLMQGGPSRRGHRRMHHGPQHGMPGFFGRGPRASRGDIRAAILVLLSEEPMHGYQIIRQLTDRSEGVWRPSPGSIYPTLQLMQDEGLVRSEETDGKRVFQLTDEGREAAAQAPSAPWDQVAAYGDTAALQIRDLVFQVIGAARQVVHAGEPTQIEAAQQVLRDARKRLYRILAEDAAAPDESDGPQAPTP